MNFRYLITLLIFIIIAGGLCFLIFVKDSSDYRPVTEQPHPVIDSLFEKMNHALRTRNYDEGADIARRALRLSRLDNYRYGEVNSLTALGFVFNHRAKYDSAVIKLEEARELTSEYKLDPALRHRAGSFLSNSYRSLGQTENALKCLQEGLEYFRNSNDTLKLCIVYNELGLLYWHQSRYEKAEEIYTLGLSYARELSHEPYYERSFTGNLGILYSELGQFEKAVPLLKTSLHIGNEMNDRTAQAIDLIHLGNIESMRGNYRGAIDNYLKAAELSEDVGETREIISAYKNIASIYDALNDFSKAEYYYRKGTFLVETELAGKHEYYPEIYKAFGDHWLRTGKYDEADNYLTKALEGYRLIEVPLDRAQCRLSVAKLRHKQNDLPRSIQYSRTALRTFEEIGAAPDFLAEAYLQLGRTYETAGQTDSASVFLKQAIEISTNFTRYDIAWQAHYYLAKLQNSAGHPETAIRELEKAISAIEKLRRFTISPELGSSFLENKVTVYQEYFDLLYDAYESYPERKIMDKLLAVSEKTRSRALLENLKAGYRSVFMRTKESAGLQNIESQIVALNLHIREELLNPPENRKTGLLRSWRKELTALQEEYELLKSRFAASDPELSALLGVGSPITLTQLQNSIPQNTALISYYMTSKNVYAFNISGNIAELIKLSVSPETLRTGIANLRKPFQDLKDGKVDFYRLPFDADLSHSIYQEVLSPVLSRTGDIKKLIIIPAGPLSYLPFEMLVSKKRNYRSKNEALFSQYSKYRYIIEDYNISYLPSSNLIAVLASSPGRKAEKALLALGNPIVSPEKIESETAGDITFFSQLRALSMTPLPGASFEVEGIMKIFNPENVTGLIESEATESVYKKSAKNYRFIHFATHGYVNEENPNFSALLLNPGDENEDGLLYIQEIYSQPLKSDLVSLSACETGLGKFMKSEGLISFVQAFFAAGSRNVMASLWTVEETTYPLMIAFYKNISAGMEYSQALRNAKLEFMQGYSGEESNRKFSHIHPFLWAPFILYGL